MVSFNEIEEEIIIRLNEIAKILKEIRYSSVSVTPEEFYDYVTGEIFSEDLITIFDVLESSNLMLHEVVEISELKKQGKVIDKRVIVDSPRELVYEPHFTAMEYELEYLQSTEDAEILGKRLRDHYLVLTDDPNLPESMKQKALEIWEKHGKSILK